MFNSAEIKHALPPCFVVKRQISAWSQLGRAERRRSSVDVYSIFVGQQLRVGDSSQT